MSRASTKPAAAGLLSLVVPSCILSDSSKVSPRLFARVLLVILMFPSRSHVACMLLTGGGLTAVWLN